MTVTEVLSELSISRPALYRRINAGRIKPLPKQFPARDKEPLRFNRSDVMALLLPKPDAK
jgi:predicted DNA-binding transcriptional regulator AlpA